MSRKTIFERYGGFTRISRVVMSFYEKMLDSPVCSPYFASTDMKRLVDHQTKLIASLMGGPVSYSNEQLERVHAHLGITEVAFLESVTLMEEALEDFNFDETDIHQVTGEMMSRKNFIVAKK